MENSVTNIGLEASPSCPRLSAVTIPDSVTTIGGQAFYACFSLTSLAVSSNNASYSSLAGVLFNKSQTVIIAYPEGLSGSYTIPNSVTSFGEGAFENCYSLTHVTIPNSVTNIASFAFGYCASLTTVTIGNSVTSI